MFALTWLAAILISLLALAVPKARRCIPALLVALAVADGLTSFSLASRATVSGPIHARQVWDAIDAAHVSTLDQTRRGLQREVEFTALFDPYPNNHNIPLRIATFKAYEVMTNRFKEDFPNHPVLVTMSTGNDRIWFASDAAQLPPTDASYAAFARRSEELGAPLAVIHSPQSMRNLGERSQQSSEDAQAIGQISRLPPAQRIAIDLLRYAPNYLDFQVRCPSAGWLIVTDRWSSGWTARLNGRRAEVFGADFIFRALRVGPGQSTVQLSYRPAGFPYLLILSWGTLVTVCANSLRNYVRRSS